MDPAGLAIGAFALISLFNNAVECFEYVQLGRDFPRDFETVLLKLDDAKLRLQKWGKSTGLVTPDLNTQADEELLKRNFSSSEDVKRVERRLRQILRLFGEAEVVSNKLTTSDAISLESLVNSGTGDDPGMTKLRERMRDLAISRTRITGLRKKAQWALHDEKMFRKLIGDVGDLIHGLTEHFPPALILQPTEPGPRVLNRPNQELETASASSLDLTTDSDTFVSDTQLTSPAEAATPKVGEPTAGDTIPFRPDPDFVDRSAEGVSILSQIQNKCSKAAARVALVGLGGIGKSQLAIQYAHEARKKSPETWVFWVHGASAARFEEGYRMIADRIRLPERKYPDADILQLVYHWLSDERNGNWIMILDNVDDKDILFPKKASRNLESAMSSRQPISSYLPQSRNGSLLATTRSRDVAFRLTGRYDDIIRLDPMGVSDALELLRNKLGDLIEDQPAAELVEALEYMPLAITQAAAYIRQRAPHMSVEKYLDMLRKSDRSRIKLLDYDEGDLRRDRTAANSIISALHISFDYIREVRPSAANLLSIMCFFDRHGIPERMLWYFDWKDCDKSRCFLENISGDDEVDSLISDESWNSCDDAYENFQEDVVMLHHFSLITAHLSSTPLCNTFEMHRLVQLSVKKWLELSDIFEEWKTNYVYRLWDQFPLGELEEWKLEHLLFPHVEAAMALRPKEGDNAMLEKWSILMFRAGCHARNTGDIELADRMLQLALRANEKLYGKEHWRSWKIKKQRANCLQDQGSAEEAAKMLGEMLAESEKIHGKFHEKTVGNIISLAEMFQAQGKYTEADKMVCQAIETLEPILEGSHPRLLWLLASLAISLAAQGDTKAAEAIERRVLASTEALYGAEDPKTLDRVDGLAHTLQDLQETEEAEALFRRVLDGRTRVLGPDHPEIFESAYNLALLLAHNDRYEEARELSQQAMDGQEKIFGPKHQTTLASIRLLGFNLLRLARSSESIIRTLKIARKTSTSAWRKSNMQNQPTRRLMMSTQKRGAGQPGNKMLMTKLLWLFMKPDKTSWRHIRRNGRPGFRCFPRVTKGRARGLGKRISASPRRLSLLIPSARTPHRQPHLPPRLPRIQNHFTCDSEQIFSTVSINPRIWKTADSESKRFDNMGGQSREGGKAKPLKQKKNKVEPDDETARAYKAKVAADRKATQAMAAAASGKKGPLNTGAQGIKKSGKK